MRRFMFSLVGTALVCVLAGCDSGGIAWPEKTSAAPPPGLSKSEVGAAADAYLAYLDATDQVEMHPSAAGTAAVRELAIDPERTSQLAFLKDLREAYLVARGTPPRARLRVLASKAATHTVTIRNCPLISPSWGLVNTTTGKPVSGSKGKAYASVAEVVRQQGDWKVRKVRGNTDHTCTA